MASVFNPATRRTLFEGSPTALAVWLAATAAARRRRARRQRLLLRWALSPVLLVAFLLVGERGQPQRPTARPLFA